MKRSLVMAIAMAIAIEAVMSEMAAMTVVAAPPPAVAVTPEEPQGIPALLVTSVAAVEPSAADGDRASREARRTEPRKARHARRPAHGARVGKVVGLIVLAGVLTCVGLGVAAEVAGEELGLEEGELADADLDVEQRVRHFLALAADVGLHERLAAVGRELRCSCRRSS